MKGLLIYFSGTGNTKLIGNFIKKEFNKHNHEIFMYSIEEKHNINWNTFDFFIFGSPKYYEYTPLFFINWIKNNVPKLSHPIKSIIFCTGTAPISTSYKKLGKILSQKNCMVVTTKTFEMPNNFLVAPFKQISKRKYSLYLKWNVEKISLMVQDFLDGIYNKEKINPFIGFMCKNISFYFCNMSKKKSRHFSVTSKCNKCKECINNCPTNNIQFQNGKIVFKDNCILCTRCINSCPHGAILYKNKKIKQYTYNLSILKKSNEK